MSTKKLWMGPGPTDCDVCKTKILTTFVDGKTRMGSWACMCPKCSRTLGVGLGLGKGQQYEKQPNGEWLKVKG